MFTRLDRMHRMAKEDEGSPFFPGIDKAGVAPYISQEGHRVDAVVLADVFIFSSINLHLNDSGS